MVATVSGGRGGSWRRRWLGEISDFLWCVDLVVLAMAGRGERRGKKISINNSLHTQVLVLVFGQRRNYSNPKIIIHMVSTKTYHEAS